MKRPTKLARALGIAFLCSCSLSATPAFAQGAKPTGAERQRDAGKHFQRGVALFNEADYSGALSEFKRAYELAPNAAVLYNIGQTHFQMRAYAAALTTFERYLAESGASAEHRAEVESAVETLRTRVGRIDVSGTDGAEVAIDDEPAGKTPLAPILAAVGRRKVVVTKEGRAPVTRYVEVSAGETVRVDAKLEEPKQAERRDFTPPPPAAPSKSSALPVILWVGAGALAAGAVTTGILASGASRDLKSERDKDTASRASLDDASSKAKTLALVTDVLGGAAIVTAGVALYLTLSTPSSSASSRMRVRVSASNVALDGVF